MYNNTICVNKFYLISLTYANNSIPSSLIPPFLLIRFFVNILKAFNEQKNGCSRKLELIKTINSLFYLMKELWKIERKFIDGPTIAYWFDATFGGGLEVCLWVSEKYHVSHWSRFLLCTFIGVSFIYLSPCCCFF